MFVGGFSHSHQKKTVVILSSDKTYHVKIDTVPLAVGLCYAVFVYSSSQDVHVSNLLPHYCYLPVSVMSFKNKS